MVCAALAYTLLSLCFISFAACLKQCINFCAKAEHAYDGTAIESVNKPAGFCVLLCQSMDGCEGFNYDSAAATCHLISSAHNLTAAAGLTAWSMKLCSKYLYHKLIFVGISANLCVILNFISHGTGGSVTSMCMRKLFSHQAQQHL